MKSLITWESWLFHQLESSASTDLLGWVVASYSIGQLIASPFFGMMANRMRKSREPLVISLIINILANILYAYLEDIKTHRVVFLIAARALIGFGAGMLFIHVLLFCVFSMYSPVVGCHFLALIWRFCCCLIYQSGHFFRTTDAQILSI